MIWIVFSVIALALFILSLTFGKEGTAKGIMKAGEFDRIIFRWKGYFMDEDDNIWPTKDWEISEEEKGVTIRVRIVDGKEIRVKEKKVKGRIFGGLFWIGAPRPIYQIHKYNLRWTDFRQAEEAGKIVLKLQFHDEPKLDSVMLKPATYGIELIRVETRPPERIPVDVKIAITMRIINPRKFLFVAPPTPLEDVIARIIALMRPRFGRLILDELIKLESGPLWVGIDLTEEAKKILGEEKILGLKDEPLIKNTLPEWGLEILERGIEIKEVDLAPEYQKAAAAKKEQEMKAAGRAEEIMGTVILAVTRAEGRKEEEVQAEFRTDPQVFYQKHQPIVDNTITKLSMEERAYLRIETPGATGMEGAFLDLIGAWKRIPMGEKEEEEVKAEEIEKSLKPASPHAEAIMKKAGETLRKLRPLREKKRKQRKSHKRE